MRAPTSPRFGSARRRNDDDFFVRRRCRRRCRYRTTEGNVRLVTPFVYRSRTTRTIISNGGRRRLTRAVIFTMRTQHSGRTHRYENRMKRGMSLRIWEQKLRVQFALYCRLPCDCSLATL